MAKCKDCLHYEACLTFSKFINAARDVEQGCEHFKDRTNYAEVVRCKDCQCWDKAVVNKKGFLICPASGMEIMADDFCSYGERREDIG